MKKYLAVLIASLLIILAGCGPENGTAEQTTKAASLNAISADEIDTTVGKSDQDAAYDESSATKNYAYGRLRLHLRERSFPKRRVRSPSSKRALIW